MLILDIPSDTIVMPVIFSVNVGLAGGEEVLGLDSSKKKKKKISPTQQQLGSQTGGLSSHQVTQLDHHMSCYC